MWLLLPFLIFPKSFHSDSSLFKPYTSDDRLIGLSPPIQPPMITQAKLVSGWSGTQCASLTTHGSGGPWAHFWLFMDHFAPIDQCDFLFFTLKISTDFKYLVSYLFLYLISWFVDPPITIMHCVDPSSDWMAQLEWSALGSSNDGPSDQLLFLIL